MQHGALIKQLVLLEDDLPVDRNAARSPLWNKYVHIVGLWVVMFAEPELHGMYNIKNVHL